MKKINLLSLSFLFIIQFLFAQEKELSKNELVKDPLNAKTYVLDNGLTVILSSNKTKPRCYTAIAVKAGSKNDPADNTGLAHYLEHLLFKGTDVYGTGNYQEEKKYLDQINQLYEDYIQITDPAKRKIKYQQIDSISSIAAKYSIANEYDKMMSHIGANGTNAFTSFEQTVYINDIPSNALNVWLDIEAERFRNPVFRLFHTELEAVYEEKNISIDNDFSVMYETLYAKLFPNHPYGTQTTIGTIEHLKNPSLKKIREYYQKYYVPNNMAIIISGDIDFETTLNEIKTKFSYLKPKPLTEFTYKQEPNNPKDQIINLVGKDEAQIAIGVRLPKASIKDVAVAKVFSMLMYNGKTGLIDLNINQKQKVIESSLYYENMNDYGLIELFITPSEKLNMEQTTRLFLDQFDSVLYGKFDESVIKAILENNEVDKIKQSEDNQGRVFELLEAFVLNQTRESFLQIDEEMKKVTKSDLMNFAKQNLLQNRVIIYKKTGTPPEKSKVIKPAITAVEMNRDKKSPFLENVLDRKLPEVKPQFLDFKKQIKEDVIKDGVNLIYTPNSINELFGMYYIYDFGSNEDKLMALATEFIQYCGTSTMPAAILKKKMYQLAVSFNVFTSKNRIYVSLSGKADKFKDGLSIMENLLSDAQSDQKTWDDFINNKILELNNRKLNKYEYSSGLANYMKYGSDNPFKHIITPKELKKISLSDVITKIKSLKTYPHSIAVYAPLDLFPMKIKQLIKPYYETKTILAAPNRKVFEPLVYNEKTVFHTHYDMVQAEINWYKKASVFNPSMLTNIGVMNEYFGGGMSSIVFQTIRESKALAYSTYSYYARPEFANNSATIGAYIGTQADKFIEAVNSMNELLLRMPESKQGFANSLNAIKSSIENQRLNREEAILYYLNNKRLGIDYDSREKVYQDLGTYQFSDLSQFHNTEYLNGQFTISVLGSKKFLSKKKLAQFGKVKTVKSKELFGY